MTFQFTNLAHMYEYNIGVTEVQGTIVIYA